MALSKSALKSGILAAFQKIKSNPGQALAPNMSLPVARELADAYHTYASTAMAGSTTITIPGQASTLAGVLSSVPLFLGWGPGMLAYWSPVMFGGPGFIPSNPTVAAAIVGATAEIALLLPPNIITIRTEEEFAEKLSTILDRWTKLVMVVTTTTTPTPVVLVVPVS